jgi:poly(hydroxyalkanoate) depolymerase family esterase
VPNLAETVAALSRFQRPWTHTPQAQDQGLLSDIVDFGANPGALRMRIYRPAQLQKRAPLVVVLHGCRQTAEGYAVGAGWLALADRFGFALLCPEQLAANNALCCFNWFEPGDMARDHGEAASIRQMIDWMLADGRLDRKRVFVTGLSAGGAMTNVMLAAYPEIFAGGAPIAGLPYGVASDAREAFGAMFQGVRHAPQVWGDYVRAASSYRGPWPKVSVWHGDADTTVKPDNGEAIALQWANVHGLPPTPGAVETEGAVRRSVWLDGRGVPAVERFVIHGLGHGTPLATLGPDGCGAAGPFLLDVGVSSSGQIAKFWGVAESVRQAAPKPSRPEPQGARGAGAKPAPRPEVLTPFSPPPHPRPQLNVGRTLKSVLKAIGLRR